MIKSANSKKNGIRQLNVMFGDFSYFNRQTTYELYTPLSIGLIGQYAKQQYGDDINVSLFKSVDKFFEKAAQNPPDVVGLSIYYWNIEKNKYVVNRLRQMFGQKVTIVIGGPCIDSDKNEQVRYLSKVFPEVNAITINEGEQAFSNILGRVLGKNETIFKDPIDGASFLKDNNLISGRPIGTSMDLATLGSPYLSGLMDDFLHSDYQPLIQTSRFCPYTCAFCVSGKSRGKLRGYPMDQVKEELRYVSKKYADRPHHTMYLVDENFGILKRDVEIAEAIRKCKEDFAYPQSVYFYNDKRFTETSRRVIEVMSDMTQLGVALALQTENPETLAASNRRNLTSEEIQSAIAWAKGINLTTSTDLIFGLPKETKKSFVELMDRTIGRGFDSVVIQNLIIMDGIEMNRPEWRKKNDVKTKYRFIGTHYCKHEDTFIAEHEEVVVSSSSFTYEEFFEIRDLNFMFFAVFNLNFQKWFFQFIRNLGVKPSSFFASFMKPDRNKMWPKGYLNFLDDLHRAIKGELHDTREEMVAKAKEIFEANGNDVGDASPINLSYGARLSYLEKDWVEPVLMHFLEQFTGSNLTNENRVLASSLIKLAEYERVNLKQIDEKEPLNIAFDIINWKENKFKEPLSNLKMSSSKPVKFSVDKTQASVINSFKEKFSSYKDKDFYYQAMEIIKPRKFLLHTLTYGDNQ